MSLSRTLAIAFLVCAAQLSAFSAEMAVLRNGFSIRHERREQIGEITRLYTGEGFVDIPTSQIATFEQAEDPLPPPTPQPAPTPAASVPIATGSSASIAVDIDQVVREASQQQHLDPDFVSSVIKYESNFHPHAVSNKGAQGLMQLMPQTAALLGVTNAFDPKANVQAGTAYLKQLLELYNNDAIKALAAYNAGAHRVAQYNGVPPYHETRAYITNIVRDFNRKKIAQMKAQGQPIPAPGTGSQTVSKTNAKPAAAGGPSRTSAKPKPQPAKAADPQTQAKAE